MSDYLWDKAGEPDEEVVRLEELLGGFGHRPRALELPAEAAPQTSSAARPRRFRPALLAAAALLLAMLAGAAVMLRQGGADGVGQSAEANPQALPPKKELVARPPQGPEPSAVPPKREGRAGHGDMQAKDPSPPDSQASTGGRQRRPPTVSRGPGLSRRARRAADATEPQIAARREPPAPARPEQQAAKEQLVYAMRLASAKLGEVRKMTRGEEAPRPGFNERNKIR